MSEPVRQIIPSADLKRIDWEKVRTPSDWAAILSGTALGSGLLPVAPGTWGTLAAMPLAYWANTWDWPTRALLWIALLALGTWAGKRFYDLFGIADNQSVVMDEVVGYGITAFACGQDPRSLVVAFFLFRAFDILKLFPARAVDRWSKNSANPWIIGFGVMGDDVVAGFQGLIMMLVLARFGWVVSPLG